MLPFYSYYYDWNISTRFIFCIEYKIVIFFFGFSVRQLLVPKNDKILSFLTEVKLANKHFFGDGKNFPPKHFRNPMYNFSLTWQIQSTIRDVRP